METASAPLETQLWSGQERAGLEAPESHWHVMTIEANLAGKVTFGENTEKKK